MFWLSIAVGGGLGAMARFALGQWLNRRLGHRLPWATLVVNALGCFLLGGFAAWQLPPAQTSLLIDTNDVAWAALGIGFCGSFTTISSWSLETLRLGLDRRPRALMAYWGLTAVACLSMVAIGYYLGAILAGI